MRTTYPVCCGICDDKRLRKVFQIMRGLGGYLQFSVFECQFTAMDLAKCRAVLAASSTTTRINSSPSIWVQPWRAASASCCAARVNDKEKVVQEVRVGENKPSKPYEQRADLDAGGADGLRERRAAVLLLDSAWFYGITMGMNQKNSRDGASFGCRTRNRSHGRWRRSWWRGRSTIRERFCGGTIWSRRRGH